MRECVFLHKGGAEYWSLRRTGSWGRVELTGGFGLLFFCLYGFRNRVSDLIRYDQKGGGKVVADWAKIRKEYIKGGISYQKLAAKHGVPFGTLKRIAGDEKWGQQREKVKQKSMIKSVDAIARQAADVDSSVHDAAMALLDAFQASVGKLGNLSANQLKDYGAALKSIQAVLTNGPTALDIREQEARIDKLRRDAQTADSGGNKVVTVQMGGDIDEFAG